LNKGGSYAQGSAIVPSLHGHLYLVDTGRAAEGIVGSYSVTIGGIMFAMSEVADFLVGGVVLVLILFFSSLE